MSLAAEKTTLPPFKLLKQKPPKITVTRKDDGTVYVSCDYPLGEMKRSTVHLLEEKAALHPERNFIGERDASGQWSYITYGEANRAASADVARVMDGLGHDTVAKYLFTSGSTGMPKGVLQTHRMMMAVVAGQEALRTEEASPDEVPQSLEWMPWNHIIGGQYRLQRQSQCRRPGASRQRQADPGAFRQADPQPARGFPARLRLGACRHRHAGGRDGERRRTP